MSSDQSEVESVGSDNRPHHNFGFSFSGVIEQCPAARRNHTAPKSLETAGARGTALHEVLECAVHSWMIDSSRPFLDVLTEQCRKSKVNVNDQRSVMKIGEEIATYFIDDPDISIGTEERIELKHFKTGEVLSYGWYDILLVNPKARVALIIDHKFVRKEVALAEKNRQGHCLAVSVFQSYPVDSVEVLFSMPECQSSRHTFSRAEDLPRIEQQLADIYEGIEKPYKVLHAGEHCVYCRFRGECPASVGALTTLATKIEPMTEPADFNPAKIQTPEQMALLRHWCAVVEPIIEQVKAIALEWAQKGMVLRTEINGEEIEYALRERTLPRKFSKTPMEIWNEVSAWMPVEAFITSCSLKVTSFEEVAVSVLADRLIAEHKKPNQTALAKSLNQMLRDRDLMSPEGGKIPYLKRVKVRPEKEALDVASE